MTKDIIFADKTLSLYYKKLVHTNGFSELGFIPENEGAFDEDSTMKAVLPPNKDGEERFLRLHARGGVELITVLGNILVTSGDVVNLHKSGFNWSIDGNKEIILVPSPERALFEFEGKLFFRPSSVMDNINRLIELSKNR